MAKKAGRIAEVTPDGKAGLVREADGSDHPFVSAKEKRIGDAVLFDLEDERVADGVTAKLAKLD